MWTFCLSSKCPDNVRQIYVDILYIPPLPWYIYVAQSINLPLKECLEVKPPNISDSGMFRGLAHKHGFS
jgi:hypothetical protein